MDWALVKEFELSNKYRFYVCATMQYLGTNEKLILSNIHINRSAPFKIQNKGFKNHCKPFF